MLDPDFVRKNIQSIQELIENGRGNKQKVNLTKWQELDTSRSSLIQKVEAIRAARNQINSSITGKPDEQTIAKMNELKSQLEVFEAKLKEVEAAWQEILDWMPNMRVSRSAMPNGAGEEDNIIEKVWSPVSGYSLDKSSQDQMLFKDFDPNLVESFSKHWDTKNLQTKHHLDLGEEKGWIDNKQGALVSGTRFTYLFGDLALLQYGLQQFMFNELLKRGFQYIVPPILVKDKSLYGTSHFPEQVDQVYKIKSDYLEEKQDLNLLGSSEPANFSFFMDKVVDLSNGPIRVFAYTPCFRSEVGSWGRDVKGIKRVHQFDKIEINAVCKPSESAQVFAEFLSINEFVLQSLEISYRLVRKSTGDAGYMASAEQIDPEAWLPGQKEFMEVGTDTNTTDYQARRLNIKFIDESGNKQFVHTVNDTGMPMGRMLIAIIDNYQQSDGSIKVPVVLRSFVGKDFIGR